jgi:hypothetical protein
MPNTYVALRNETVTGSNASSVTLNLSGISGYTDLVIVGNYKGTTTGSNLQMQFNSDTGTSTTNYSRTYHYGTGSTGGTGRTVNGYSIIIGTNDSAQFISTVTHIMDYANTTTHKTVLSRVDDTAGLYPAVGAIVGLWRNTSAITSITITPQDGSILVGSSFALYGIANSHQGTAKATGGIITEDSQYWYHTFGATSTIVPTQSLTVDVLSIAGGGGCGGSWGSGGGAGGVLLTSGVSLASGTSYTATIGAGGAGTANGNSAGSTGVNSNLTGGSISLTPAYGGGAGGGGSGGNGGNGGSGGGASYSGTGGSPVTGQGFKGGDADPAPSTACGGGAGEAATKNTATFSIGVRAGDGTTAYSSWGAATGTGELINGAYYYGGGGADGQGQTPRNSYGGGRRNLTNVTGGGNGVANTGAGGSANGGGYGSAGGSGLIVIRYAKV